MQLELQQLLEKTYQDFKLSNGEKLELAQLIQPLKFFPEQLNFVRNQAFKLVADHHRSNGSNVLESLKWLEGVVKTIDTLQNQTVPVQSFASFSPGKDCATQIVSLINNAKESIDVCVFTISDDNLSQALIKAYERRVKVRVITDNDKANDLGSDVYKLAAKGIAIKIDQSPNHMHHKFAIFDGEKIVNGSFNWTRSASLYNQENIVIFNDGKLLGQFAQVFENLWAECLLINS